MIVASCHKEKKTVMVPEDYHSWKKITEELLNYPIPGHENNCRMIYINAQGEKVQITLKNNRTFYDYPEGTIIVKEIYTGLDHPEEDEKPRQLTVMIKEAQHPQSRNGWLWIVKDVATGEETLIDYEVCADCHANANERHPYGDQNPTNAFRDYVYFPPSSAVPVEEKLE